MDISDERVTQTLKESGVDPTAERIQATQRWRQIRRNIDGAQLSDPAFRKDLEEAVAPLLDCGLGDLDCFFAQLVDQHRMNTDPDREKLFFSLGAKHYLDRVYIPYELRGDLLRVYSTDFEVGCASFQSLMKRMFLVEHVQ